MARFMPMDIFTVTERKINAGFSFNRQTKKECCSFIWFAFSPALTAVPGNNALYIG